MTLTALTFLKETVGHRATLHCLFKGSILSKFNIVLQSVLTSVFLVSSYHPEQTSRKEAE